MLKPNQFTDASGRVWTIEIDLDGVEAVFRNTHVSIYKLLDDKCAPLGELLGNLPALAHVCYVLTRAEDQQVSEREFLRALKGDTVNAMAKAFLAELTDFFPDARRRAAIAQIVKACLALENQVCASLETAAATLNPDQIAQAVITQLSKKGSSASPVTPASRRRKSES